jgi:hypothetical protein
MISCCRGEGLEGRREKLKEGFVRGVVEEATESPRNCEVAGASLFLPVRVDPGGVRFFRVTSPRGRVG